MKGYVLALSAGSCAYDFQHTWKAGEKIFRLQGAGWSRPKDYCWPCALARYGASDSTPEFSASVPSGPVVRPLSGLAERFDSRMAQAGKDE